MAIMPNSEFGTICELPQPFWLRSTVTDTTWDTVPAYTLPESEDISGIYCWYAYDVDLGSSLEAYF